MSNSQFAKKNNWQETDTPLKEELDRMDTGIQNLYDLNNQIIKPVDLRNVQSLDEGIYFVITPVNDDPSISYVFDVPNTTNRKHSARHGNLIYINRYKSSLNIQDEEFIMDNVDVVICNGTNFHITTFLNYPESSGISPMWTPISSWVSSNDINYLKITQLETRIQALEDKIK